ncbi:hypothetical protein HPB47_005769 [Ixodes persulcatus]|uniref:Uncharacterized protein n=1 Tax=Ixodes persulcatus TaxID=34615 RepID=A0AC60PCK0_IXOPE|nr:hypothetical protein HPB47_005769 [Ixodes persulcatus]
MYSRGWRPADIPRKRPGPLACGQCDFTTNVEGKLRLHQRCHAAGRRTFRCSLCRTAFTTKATLMRHMRMHTGERPFRCHFCSKAFVDGGHLTRHLRTHTGERPFGCPLCEATFKRKDHVTVHLRTHSVQLASI